MVCRWKWMGGNWQVKMLKWAGREKHVSEERQSLFVGGEGRDSVENLLSNSHSGEQTEGIQYLAELSNADVEGSNMGPSVWAERVPTFSFLSLPAEAKTSPCCLKAELAFLTYTAILDVRIIGECLLGLLCFCKYSLFRLHTEPDISSHSYPQLLSHLQFVCEWPKRDYCASKKVYIIWRTLMGGILHSHTWDFLVWEIWRKK